MRRNHLSALFVLSAALLLPGCRHIVPDGAAPEQARADYEVWRTAEPITVDGRLDEAAWDKASVLSFTVYKDQGEPLSLTEAGLLWDDQYLYVGFRATDKDVWSFLRQRDSNTCGEDVLEIFFNTDPERPVYYNFEINALGTVYDAYTPQWATAGHTHRWKQWDCEGLKVGIRIRGTLNDWRDEDEGWDMEVAIPFSSLETIGGKAPSPGERWSFHLARYDYSVHLPENGREISSTVPFHEPVGGFHDQTTWAPLQFRRSDGAGKD